MLMIQGIDGRPDEPLPGIGALAIRHLGRGVVGPSWSTDDTPPYRSFTHTVMRIFSGSAAIEIDGTWHRAKAGTVLLVPGFRDLRRRSDGFDHAWVNFACSSMSADLQLSRNAALRILPADAAWDAGLAVARHGLGRLRQATDGELALVEATLLRAIAEMLGHPVHGGARPADDGLVRRAVVWLDQHYRSRPSLATIATATGCSANHLHTRFTAAMGLSPVAYAEQHRLRDAHHLLTTTALPVQAVAQRCGYDDAFHFSRVVRRQFGVSPRDLRERRGGDMG